MRYRIELVIDIPPFTDEKDASEALYHQMIYDNVIRVPLLDHLEKAVKWSIKAKIGSEEEGSTQELIMNKSVFDIHNTWADILQDMQSFVVRVPDSYQPPSRDLSSMISISYPVTSWNQFKLDPILEDYPIIGLA